MDTAQQEAVHRVLPVDIVEPPPAHMVTLLELDIAPVPLGDILPVHIALLPDTVEPLAHTLLVDIVELLAVHRALLPDTVELLPAHRVLLVGIVELPPAHMLLPELDTLDTPAVRMLLLPGLDILVVQKLAACHNSPACWPSEH
jgi:hypothetical protein